MGGMRGSAELKGDHYYLNGPKWWMAMCSPGPVGLQWHLVLMKTDPTKRTSGLSLFINTRCQPWYNPGTGGRPHGGEVGLCPL